MFTGIVQGVASVHAIEERPAFRRLGLTFPEGATEGLQRGASVSVSGVCLTVVEHRGEEVAFDVIDETLARSTLGALVVGDAVNYERAARFGDEVGGHALSGHVWGRGEVVERRDEGENRALRVRTGPDVLRYVFEKGYIGIDGTSLTVGRVDREASTFWLHLIPETLAVTTLGAAERGTSLNVEVDAMTQAVVDTVERVLAERQR